MTQPEFTQNTSDMTELSPVKQALLEIRHLRSQLAAIAQARTEPIAVIGMGCRFPGGVHSPDQFWQLLQQGSDAITEVPGDRWQNDEYYDATPQRPGKIVTRWGGFLDQIDRFDPQFFGISPREAAAMDPQQRLLLEVCWEALEHAGQSPDRLVGSQTGVFVGIASMDYGHLLFSQPATEIDAYLGVGFAHSIAAGRLAYLLGVQGPTLAVDTACSSSLVAVHQAVQNLRHGTCEMALVGGVNVILLPEVSITFSQAQMLAKDGRCKTFDARADGYVRSEGCGVVVLKRLADAIAQRDSILAVIQGSAINHDGRSSGITAPNGPSQTAVIQAALADARLQPKQVRYVETHGTGTALGDPIEVQALDAALGQGRSPDQPLLIGAVKTNIGHLEAAAGIAGLIKVVLALQHRQIPATLHLQHLNPQIDWERMAIAVPTQPLPFASEADRAIAGVSSFGFSGTNAHVVLAAAPPTEELPPVAARPCQLLTLSVKREADLMPLLQRYQDYLDTTPDSLADICFTANAGRAHLTYRVAAIVASKAELRQQLAAFQAGSADALQVGQVFAAEQPEVTFVFGNQEIPLPMVRHLVQTQPTFRAVLELCEPQLSRHLGRSWLAALTATAEPEWLPELTQFPPGQFAVQSALAHLWRSWGVAPALVLGEGVGELVAACIAGVFSLEDGLKLAIARHQGEAGDSAEITYALPQIGVLSTATGDLAAAAIAQSAYWQPQPQQTALPHLLKTLAAQEQRLFLEIAPHPDLATAVSQVLPASVWLLLMQPDRDPERSLLDSLAALHLQGVAIDWIARDRETHTRRVALPTYPWARDRYWIQSSPSSPPVTDELRWQAVATAAQQQAQQAPLDLALADFPAKWHCLEQLTTAYVSQTLQDLGGFAQVGDRASVDQILSQYQILPTYRPLLRRWLKRLVAAAQLQQQGEEFVSLQPFAIAPLETAKQQARQTLAADPQLLDYVERCGDRLAAILTGNASPLETLFPSGSYDTANYLYRDWALIRYFSNILRQVIAAIAQQSPDRRLRLLEIGAGTGGTAAVLLPVLPAQRTHYQFTDVSDFFLNRAAQRLSDYPFVRYSLLDIEQDPVAQGYAPGSFDVIVAANVLHATADLQQTVDHVRSLLAPGGWLVLFEATQHLAWFDITTGLIEGWERFGDDLRQEDPLLSSSQWQTLLQTIGFDRVAQYPAAGDTPEILGCHVITAQIAATGQIGSSSAAPIDPQISLSSPPNLAPAPDATLGEALRQQLATALPAERRDRLVAFVREQVASVLRAPAATLNARHRLMDVGVDSLMAVELRDRLQMGLGLTQTLPATLMFDYPTIAAIADYLQTLMPTRAVSSQPPESTPASAAPAPPAPDPTPVAAIAQLSDQDVEALLLEKLSRLEY